MGGSDESDLTAILADLQRGSGALDALIPLVYGELRSLAAAYLRGEREDGTLQPTVLVHEVFLRLVDQRTVTWENRAHFFGVAAQLMRRIIVDHARRRNAEKRGPGRVVTLDDEQASTIADGDDILGVDEALRDLEQLDPRRARIVELRYFGGLTIEETAQTLDVSPATVKRDWLLAKAWLHRELTP